MAAVACLALWLTPRRAAATPTSGRTMRNGAATLCALGAFGCMPWGPLPALCPWAYSGLCAVGLVLAACVCQDRPWAETAAPLRSLAALGLLAWYALRRGVPGDIFSLDTFVATPVLGNSPLPDFAPELGGILLLALATLPVRSRTPAAHGVPAAPVADTLPATLRTLALSAVWCCLFIPQGLSTVWGLQHIAALALDVLYFWGSVLTVYAATRALPPWRYGPHGQTACLVAGGVLLA